MIPNDTALCICDFETTGLDPDADLPIEIGCIWTDSRLNLVAVTHALILWPRLAGMDAWPSSAEAAAFVHRIPFAVWRADAEDPDDVAGLIGLECDRVRAATRARRVVLLSDNAQFEFRFMRRLLAESDAPWPFHYAAWDANLLLEASGVGDPVPVHRALEDAGRLHAALVRACERVGSFEETT